jgi:hypothetical protein
MKTRAKKCKNCAEQFTPLRFNQKYCFNVDCIRVWVDIEKAKKWAKDKREKKAELMTLSDHLKITQAIVNKYIRTRDEGQPCISCGSHINGVKHASHYMSSGGHSSVRFHEDNIWVSCYKCNVMLSSNAIEYRKRLIKKIGVDRVEWLEDNGSDVKRWSVEELKEIQEKFKEKTNQLKNN